MLTLTSPQVVQETALRWKRESKIALIPTMGCLHEGHLRLVAKARQYAPKVIVSIFVNPLQFGPNEDFGRYPRTLDEDRAKLDEMNVDLLFAPSVDELYPAGFETRVSVGKLASHLCGASRPGHFDGVATVCLKLFNIAQADFAVFGEKDFQQLRIIQQMAADLNLPVSILPHPTAREEDGLAMSSRNRYLSPDERKLAASLPRSLAAAHHAAKERGALVGDVLRVARKALGDIEIDYLCLAAEKDLQPLSDSACVETISDARIFAAVKVGKTRLIDNLALSSGEE